MGIVWLASYPKSGNTWVRFLLYNALFGEPSASIDVSRRIPDIHRPLPFDQPSDGRLMVKTHFAFSDKHPKAAMTERAIVVTRHPRDVALSALNYRRLAGLTPGVVGDAAYIESFLRDGGDSEWARQGFGTWAGNARSWLDAAARFPVLRVRYEDLHADAAAQLARMLEFLGVALPGERIAAAAERASFTRMREIEDREKADPGRTDERTRLFVGHPSGERRFMNAGQTGQSLDGVAPGLTERFDAAFAAAMRDLGYGA
jgi:hypothetical protein